MSFYPKWLTILLYYYTVDTAAGSNSGLSVLLKDTSTRAGIEPPTPWLKDGPADLWPSVTHTSVRQVNNNKRHACRWLMVDQRPEHRESRTIRWQRGVITSHIKVLTSSPLNVHSKALPDTRWTEMRRLAPWADRNEDLLQLSPRGGGSGRSDGESMDHLLCPVLNEKAADEIKCCQEEVFRGFSALSLMSWSV